MIHYRKGLPFLLSLILGAPSIISTGEQTCKCTENFVPELNSSSNEYFDNAGVQLLFPDLRFNCSGKITNVNCLVKPESNYISGPYFILQVWKTVEDENSETYEVRNAVSLGYTNHEGSVEPKVLNLSPGDLFVQPGDVIGILMPGDPLPLLYSSLGSSESNDSGVRAYYADGRISGVCKASLCSEHLQRMDGIRLQLRVNISTTTVSTRSVSERLCTYEPKFTECQGSKTVTSTLSYHAPSPSPTTSTSSSTVGCGSKECGGNGQSSASFLPSSAQIAIPVVLSALLLVLLAVTIVVYILHKRKIFHKNTGKVDSSSVERYMASNGSVYTTVSPNRKSKKSLQRNPSVLTEETIIVEPDGLEPYAELRMNEPSTYKIPLASTSNDSLQISSPIEPYAASKFDVQSPIQNHSRHKLSLGSPRPPQAASLFDVSGHPVRSRRATVGSNPFKQSPHPYMEPSTSLSMQQRCTFSMDGVSQRRDLSTVKNASSSPRLVSPRSVVSPSLPVLGEGEEGFTVQPYQEPKPSKHPSDSSNSEVSTKPSTIEMSPFPYCELKESPLNARKKSMPARLVQSHMNLQRSGSASPYLEPSPNPTTKRKRQALVGKLSAGFSSGIPPTNFIYEIPKTSSNTKFSQKGKRGKGSSNQASSVINLRSNEASSVYSRLDRNFSQQAIQYHKEHELPNSPSDDIYNTAHPQQKYRELSRESVSLGKKLGSGHFGEVYFGVCNFKEGKLDVAIKTLKPGLEKHEKDKFLQEAIIMGQFFHSNVVKLHGVVSEGEPLMICLELMSKGDLRLYLQDVRANYQSILKNQSMYAEQFLGFCRQIASGMAYLASKDFVHRDLAARNIFLNDELTCKIGDFGMSRDLAQDDFYESKGGEVPLRWTAPEALNYKRYTMASDVWSYGMLLFEIWSVGSKPFHGKKFDEILPLINSCYCQPPPPGCPRKIYELMIHCWSREPTGRPTFSAIVDYLGAADNELLQWSETDLCVSETCKLLGAPLEEGTELFTDLQQYYSEYI